MLWSAEAEMSRAEGRRSKEGEVEREKEGERHSAKARMASLCASRRSHKWKEGRSSREVHFQTRRSPLSWPLKRVSSTAQRALTGDSCWSESWRKQSGRSLAPALQQQILPSSKPAKSRSDETRGERRESSEGEVWWRTSRGATDRGDLYWVNFRVCERGDCTPTRLLLLPRLLLLLVLERIVAGGRLWLIETTIGPRVVNEIHSTYSGSLVSRELEVGLCVEIFHNESVEAREVTKKRDSCEVIVSWLAREQQGIKFVLDDHSPRLGVGEAMKATQPLVTEIPVMTRTLIEETTGHKKTKHFHSSGE
jgi:hypothetical protein